MLLKPLAVVHDKFQMLWDVGTIGSLTDAQLLERFLAGSDAVSEASFTVLVERYGPNVRRVCLDLLGDSHEAQDAAQAVFLVLARNARSIRKPDSLGPWLHGVALRMARRARAAAARRRELEHRRAEVMSERIKSKQGVEQDQYAELYEEIERLPEKYRGPIILCYFQGHTQEQVSRRLGWPLGTVQTRLHRGRERLRARLSRRGVGLGGLAATVLALPQTTAAAASIPISPGWATATASAAVRFAGGKTTAEFVSPAVVKLAEGVVVTMLKETLKAFSISILVAGLAATGASLCVQSLTNVRVLREASAELITDMAQPAVKPAISVAKPGTLAVARQQRARVTPPDRKRPDVEPAIRAGARYLKAKQQPDGSWPDVDGEARTGMTSLITLALLGADEPASSPAITRAIDYLQGFTPDQLHSVYAVSLQTRAFIAAAHKQDRPRIAANVEWLEGAQIKPGDGVKWPGCWTYSQSNIRPGDNSNTFYALLGLRAAAEAGVPVNADVWTLAHRYWSAAQRRDGGWGYTADMNLSTSSMTCEGIASLILTRARQAEGQESPEGAGIRDCGTHNDPALSRGIVWLTNNFHVSENFPNGQQWKFYFLDVLEQAGQLSGERLFSENDWFQDGARELIRTQSLTTGEWRGTFSEHEPLIATSFALMFVCRGRSPVLIQKARHAPGDDWTNDPDDVRNLVGTIARDWNMQLNWQIVDIDSATVSELMLAPILFLNGHQSPEFNARAKRALRAYVEQGGFIFAEACCGQKDFDRGLRTLLSEIFPGTESQLHPLAVDHPVWSARHALEQADHPLWGLERGGRTVLIYSPTDLSCRWNVRNRYPDDQATRRATKLGENVVAYASRRTATDE
jgi:RNA polymerase sigma factor (sigma-70 family)